MSNWITVYTDGAALGNPGPGGFGVVMFYGGHRKEISEGFRMTTNNRMELLAVIVALQNIKDKSIPVKVFTDSKYVCDSIEKKWIEGWVRKGFKNVKNPDLWKLFLETRKGFQLELNWVKGHAGIKENERCDELATTAAKNNPIKVDQFFENLRNSESTLDF